MEGELRTALGCGERTPDSSQNIAIEVKVCDEFREAQNCMVEGDGSTVAVERVFGERLATDPVKEEPHGENGCSGRHEDKVRESVLLSEGWQKEDPRMSQSQAGQKIFKETTCGTFGAAAAYANGGEGPLCKEDEELHMQPFPAGDPEKGLQAEIKQEPAGECALFDHGLPFLGSVDPGLELHSGTSRAAVVNSGEGPLCKEEEKELHIQPCHVGDPEKGLQAELKQELVDEPVTPGYPLPGSAVGLKVQCVWSMATRSGKVGEILQQHGRNSEHGGARSKSRFSSRHYRASRRLRSEKEEGPTSHLEQQQNGCPHEPPDGPSGEMVFPLVSQGERTGGFAQLSHLKSHQRVHTGEKPYSCDECGKSFAHLSTLKSHQRVHTGEKPFSCEECGKSFPHLNNVKIHQRVHTKEKPHTCEECGKSFAHLSHFKSHQTVHTGEKPYSCEECGKSFAHRPNLNAHQRVHTGEKPHSCDKCGKGFSQLSNLKSHQHVHTGEKPLTCDECGKSFALLCKLKIHQRVHTGEKPHSCDKCGKSFSQQGYLKIHQRVYTGEKPHSCENCGKSFSHPNSLKTHQRVHTGEKPYSCDECSKSFSHLVSLKIHRRVHTAEKPHSCDKCGKSFAHLGYLKIHQHVHTGEKLLSCDKCGKSFSHLQALKYHQRAHTGEKPHSCDECGKSFSHLHNLKTHQRVHTREKPYSCTLCGKSFSQNVTLQRHMLTHSL